MHQKLEKLTCPLQETIETLYVRRFQEGLGHDSFDGQEKTRMVLGGQEVVTFASENGPQSLV